MSTDALLAEREKTHGKYSEFASVVQGLKLVIDSYQEDQWRCLSFEHEEAIDMILHKVARIVTGDPNCKDHWDDIAGYATLGGRYVKTKVD